MPTTESSTTSQSLVNRLREQREDDWERYVEVYSPMLALWCVRRRVRVNDAAEIIQQVHANIFEHIGGFDHTGPKSTFRGWLYVILQNAIADYYQQQNRLAELTPEMAAALREPMSDEEDRADLAGLVRRTLQLLEDEEELPKGPREAFLAHHFEQKAIDEIALEMGLSRGAVHKRINRAATKLREILAPEFPHLTGEGVTAPSDE